MLVSLAPLSILKIASPAHRAVAEYRWYAQGQGKTIHAILNKMAGFPYSDRRYGKLAVQK
ncbi:MAG: hypothetical protein DMG13_19100 [Acidobacteria bacterium]|nr:MAG: hypothetical protein DMG13_19100 [Acidobacteriota bacterium]